MLHKNPLTPFLGKTHDTHKTHTRFYIFRCKIGREFYNLQTINACRGSGGIRTPGTVTRTSV